MRLNKFIASATGMSRRSADAAIANGRVMVNGQPAETGQSVDKQDLVTLDGQHLVNDAPSRTYILHKPDGYVVSRDGQGSRTIYDLIPQELHHLKPVGRLDKDSSGLLLLTNDGNLANELTHPSRMKIKVYEVGLLKPLSPTDKAAIEQGVMLDDGISRLKIEQLANSKKQLAPGCQLLVTMTEGRNRQIRRTFAALGYTVHQLHRTAFGPFQLGDIAEGACEEIDR